MSYNVHCNTLLDTSRQLLLDGKTLVELIHAQDVEDLDEKVMCQVRQSISDTDSLARAADAVRATLAQHFGAGDAVRDAHAQNSTHQVYLDKFRLHEQIFLNTANTVQNSMVTLTRLTKSIISNIYMQTDISVSRGNKVDNCCKNLTTALKSMISAMEVMRKMGDDYSKNLQTSPVLSTHTPPLAKDEELSATPSSEHDLILEGACKTMRDLVQKLVTLVLDHEGDRSDVEYAKNFYDIGRVTMNHMVKIINLAKKIGLTDEEHRLKLLLFQLLSLAKSFNSNVEITGGTVPQKQVQELQVVKVQIEESLWWFVKLAKLKIKLIAPRSDQEALSPREKRKSSPPSPPTVTLPKPLPPLPKSASKITVNGNNNNSITSNNTNNEYDENNNSKPEITHATRIASNYTRPRRITPTTSQSKFEHSINKLATANPEEQTEPDIRPVVAQALSRSASLASIKATDYVPATPTPKQNQTDENKSRRKVIEIPPEVLHGIVLPDSKHRSRPVSQGPLELQKEKAQTTTPASPVRSNTFIPASPSITTSNFLSSSTPSRRISAYLNSNSSSNLQSLSPPSSPSPLSAPLSPTLGSKSTERPTLSVKIDNENIDNVDLPPDLPPKPQGLRIATNKDKDHVENMTLRSGVLRRAAPQSVIFDTKQQSTMGVYIGDLEAQLMNFRAKVTAHLEYILLDTYMLNKEDMDMLMNEKDAKVNALWSSMQTPKKDQPKSIPSGRKNMGVKRIKPFDDFTQIFSRNEMEASAELARRLEAIIQGTFDQYEGLRQINDFRSIPEVGQSILQTSNVTHGLLKKQLISGSILIVCNFLFQVLSNKEITKIYLPATKDEFVEASRHEHNLKLATDNILLEYCKLKAGLLMQTGYVSSIVEQENGFNLNHVIVDKFLTEIYEITENCINTQAELFAKRAADIEKLPKKRQKVIFAKFGGKEAFGQLANSTLALLRPWMRKWVDVQVPSIVQRELFAKDVQALKSSLEGSKNSMVASFQELLNNQVPEPLYKFDAILKSIDEELELVAAIFGI